MDQKGFQRVLIPIRVRISNAEPTHTANTFHLLNDEAQHKPSDNGTIVDKDIKRGVTWVVCLEGGDP